MESKMADDQISIISLKVHQSSKSISSATSKTEENSVFSLEELPTTAEVEEINENSAVTPIPENVSYWNLFHVITILGWFTTFFLPFAFIPRHNSILYPEYWYEINISIVAASLYSTVNMLLNCFVFTSQKKLISFGVLLKMWGWNMLGFVIPYTISYVVWVVYLGYNHPMPFLGLCQFVSWISVLSGTWFLFPTELLNEDEFRKKLKTYMFYSLWWFAMNIQRIILSIVFKNISIHLQWMFSILVPSLREMNKRVLSKLVHKMAGKDDERANVLLGMNVNVHYALFVAISLSGAEFSTVICMVSMDFFIHLQITYKYIQLQRKVATNENEKDELAKVKQKAITKLILAELCEGIVPLCYAIAFSMIYYGPNAAITGNVGISIWGYKKVENVKKLFGVMFLLFGIDTISVSFNACYLWTFGSFNIFCEFVRVLKKYWYILLVQLVFNIYTIFASNDINLAMDFTMKFQWTTDEGRKVLFYNTTELYE